MSRAEALAILCFQLAVFVFFLIFGKYDATYDAEVYPKYFSEIKLRKEGADQRRYLCSIILSSIKSEKQNAANMFQDIHAMIFVGFGFLMTFLNRYGFSAVGFNFLLGALMIQWSVICQGFVKMGGDWKIKVNIESLFNADIATGSVLISMGAVLGMTTYLQLLIMGLIEVGVYSLNLYIGSLLVASDAGGSIFVHTFGAYFGLGVSYSLGRKLSTESKLETSTYTSNMFSMIGTLFLWIYWPSFNAISQPPDERYRTIINTYLSLASCCVTTFFISSLLSSKGKFDIVHIQNSTLAGGVAIGTSANLLIQPYGALIVGMLAAMLSVFGFVKLTPWLNTRFKIHDTCGVNNLHGMPGIFGGLIGAFMASIATENDYHDSLYQIFPARSAVLSNDNMNYTSEYHETEQIKGRNAYEQTGFQLLCLFVTILFALVGGRITGIILSFERLILNPNHLYNDAAYWNLFEDNTCPPTTTINVGQKSRSQLMLFSPNME